MKIDLETIGYFLFMEEQEKKKACSLSIEEDTDDEAEDKEV